MTEDEMDRLAAKIADAIAVRQSADRHITINVTGQYAGSKADLAKPVTTAIRDAIRRGQLPPNVLTGL